MALGEMRLKEPQWAEIGHLVRLIESGLITRFGTAVDGGAHIGGWSVTLAQWFAKVIAFEPCPESYRQLVAHTAPYSHIKARPQALMDRRCFVRSFAPPKIETLTARRVKVDPLGGITAIPLDELLLPGLSFLKLDLEGAELLALAGAMETITRCRPFIVVEEAGLGHHFGVEPGEVAATLRSWGYERVWSAGVNSGWRHRYEAT